MPHDNEKREKIELDNDRVKVTRVTSGQRGAGAPVARQDRLVVYLRDGHVVRTEGGKTEDIHHKAGDVVWRARSSHHVTQAHEEEHEVLIIELKG